MYLIIFYAPASHVETVKEAMFLAGAGHLGNYDACAWQVLGEGQFQPLPGSQPFSGQQNQVSKEAEYRVEMVCAEEHIDAAIQALKSAHPYETPAFSYWKVES